MRTREFVEGLSLLRGAVVLIKHRGKLYTVDSINWSGRRVVIESGMIAVDLRSRIGLKAVEIIKSLQEGNKQVVFKAKWRKYKVKELVTIVERIKILIFST